MIRIKVLQWVNRVAEAISDGLFWVADGIRDRFVGSPRDWECLELDHIVRIHRAYESDSDQEVLRCVKLWLDTHVEGEVEDR